MKWISNVAVKFLWITDEQITGPATSSEINKFFLAVTFFNKTCQSEGEGGVNKGVMLSLALLLPLQTLLFTE